MTHPGPRNHTEKPSTPPTGPSGVSHQPADSSPTTPINLTDEVVRMTAMVEQNLRVLLDTFGIPYTEWPAKTCRAALHRVGAGDPPGGVPCSLPLGHDGKHVTESGRAWADPTDQQIRYVVDVVADVRANGGTVVIDGVTISRSPDEHPGNGVICGTEHVDPVTEIGHMCTLAPDHVGDHRHYSGASWPGERVCGDVYGDSTNFEGVPYRCSKFAGHTGTHSDGRFGIEWESR
ncbi:hypothetical protein KNU09_gp75 [Gordonia phage TillyBobJoe]|uniref:Uncharacterized protein n=1 Tax=Gordonia phage TillyBobJoe TaxID=2301560 RepID=A0A385DS84_9CAUD|nr:hypothetical protein KNU09_gp75 [Gordonia phage TillyBobJoe]AXQ62306.1 hypothetical protein SEA_TILLYBOBJOE_75 [Gordonia phage TillyBobJoe]